MAFINGRWVPDDQIDPLTGLPGGVTSLSAPGVGQVVSPLEAPVPPQEAIHRLRTERAANTLEAREQDRFSAQGDRDLQPLEGPIGPRGTQVPPSAAPTPSRPPEGPPAPSPEDVALSRESRRQDIQRQITAGQAASDSRIARSRPNVTRTQLRVAGATPEQRDIAAKAELADATRVAQSGIRREHEAAFGVTTGAEERVPVDPITTAEYKALRDMASLKAATSQGKSGVERVQRLLLNIDSDVEKAAAEAEDVFVQMTFASRKEYTDAIENTITNEKYPVGGEVARKALRDNPPEFVVKMEEERVKAEIKEKGAVATRARIAAEEAAEKEAEKNTSFSNSLIAGGDYSPEEAAQIQAQIEAGNSFWTSKRDEFIAAKEEPVSAATRQKGVQAGADVEAGRGDFNNPEHRRIFANAGFSDQEMDAAVESLVLPVDAGQARVEGRAATVSSAATIVAELIRGGTPLDDAASQAMSRETIKGRISEADQAGRDSLKAEIKQGAQALIIERKRGVEVELLAGTEQEDVAITDAAKNIVIPTDQAGLVALLGDGTPIEKASAFVFGGLESRLATDAQKARIKNAVDDFVAVSTGAEGAEITQFEQDRFGPIYDKISQLQERLTVARAQETRKKAEKIEAEEQWVAEQEAAGLLAVVYDSPDDSGKRLRATFDASDIRERDLHDKFVAAGPDKQPVILDALKSYRDRQQGGSTLDVGDDTANRMLDNAANDISYDNGLTLMGMALRPDDTVEYNGDFTKAGELLQSAILGGNQSDGVEAAAHWDVAERAITAQVPVLKDDEPTGEMRHININEFKDQETFNAFMLEKAGYKDRDVKLMEGYRKAMWNQRGNPLVLNALNANTPQGVRAAFRIAMASEAQEVLNNFSVGVRTAGGDLVEIDESGNKRGVPQTAKELIGMATAMGEEGQRLLDAGGDPLEIDQRADRSQSALVSWRDKTERLVSWYEELGMDPDPKVKGDIRSLPSRIREMREVEQSLVRSIRQHEAQVVARTDSNGRIILSSSTQSDAEVILNEKGSAVQRAVAGGSGQTRPDYRYNEYVQTGSDGREYSVTYLSPSEIESQATRAAVLDTARAISFGMFGKYKLQSGAEIGYLRDALMKDIGDMDEETAREAKATFADRLNREQNRLKREQIQKIGEMLADVRRATEPEGAAERLRALRENEGEDA